MLYIKVKARAGAKEESVKQKSDDAFSISVTEPAENNRANRRITDILKARFPEKIVMLVKGHTTPSKIFQIVDPKNDT